MLKTERMKKVVIAGAKPHLRSVIDTLHQLAALHIEEHSPNELFGLGSPLPEGERVAEASLKARGLEKHLGLEEASTTKTLGSLDEAIQAVERIDGDVSALVSARHEAEETGKRLESEITRLRQVAPLGLRLEHLSGYTHLKAFVGRTEEDPRAALAARTQRFEAQVAPSEGGFVVAAFAATDAAADVESVLSGVGFHALEVPAGTGSIETAIGQRTTEARKAAAKVAEVDQQLAAYRTQHGETLLAASETLAVASERAGAPVRFAAGANSFVLSGFVPASRAREAEKALYAATDQHLYIAWSEPQLGGPSHGHEHEHDAHDAVPDPPIEFTHKNNGVRSFTMLLGMHSLPKYRELDPTILMWIAFPIFFGLMVADVAFGILIGLVAWWFRNHYLFGIGGPRVSRMLGLSAVWTVLLGAFMFGEAFGIHFVDEPGVVSWEHLLHQDWSAFYASAQHTVVAAAEQGAAHGAAEAEHHAPHLKVAGIQLGYYSKIHDVQTLLVISLLIAAVHLNLAILFGIRNMWVLHGAKHAILGRVSWLVLEAGVALVGYGAYDAWPMLMNAGWGLLVVAVGMLIAGEGAIAILELPKLFSNALSYTRLIAVGLSKAGMAIAVNKFAFTMTDPHSAAVAGVGGAVLLVIGYLVILGLGVLAGGLHSMRLQFVEFFGWFYEGGGRPFKAFGDRTQRSN